MIDAPAPINKAGEKLSIKRERGRPVVDMRRLAELDPSTSWALRWLNPEHARQSNDFGFRVRPIFKNRSFVGNDHNHPGSGGTPKAVWCGD